MKRVLLGIAFAGTAAFAAPHATAEVRYCDATFLPRCNQCVPAVDYTGRPICVWIGPAEGS